MPPLGRKKCLLPVGKWKVKENGKHIKAWWEDICQDSKKSARQKAKKEIAKYLNF